MRLNAIFLLVGRVVSAITTVLVLAIMARARSADDLGVVSLGLTVSLALAVLPEACLFASPQGIPRERVCSLAQ